MMGCSGQVPAMSLWEYEARLWNWNEAHGGSDNDGGGDLALPDPALTQRLIDRINSDPALNP